AALFALARTLNPASRHPWLRTYLVLAGPGGVLLGLATAPGTGAGGLVLFGGIVLIPFVTLFAWMVLCFPLSFARAPRAACLGGLAGALAGAVGLLTDSLLGWVAGGAAGLALYQGVDGWLTARATR